MGWWSIFWEVVGSGGYSYFGWWWAVVDGLDFSGGGLCGSWGGWSNQFPDNYLLSQFYEIKL